MKSTQRKTAVVTGASSGIGWASVARMVQADWTVFATVRKEEDAAHLGSEFGDSVSPVLMDVTNRESIAGAARQVAAKLNGHGLDGLVNVAGVGRVAPVECMSEADLREVFEINLFGQLAVTQAFLSLLRQAPGRIVNITSIGAHIAIPFGSLINASKSAFQMFSDTLRLELHPFGIRVSAIEPGAINTPAVEKTLGDVEAVIRSLPPEAVEQYGAMLRSFARRAYEREKHGSSPEVVARGVHHALTATRPRTRYRVGKHATLLATLAAVLPDRLLDEVRFRLTGMPSGFGVLHSPQEKHAGKPAQPRPLQHAR